MLQNLLKELESLLQKDQSFISDGAILKNAVIEAALNMDARLLELPLSACCATGYAAGGQVGRSPIAYAFGT